MYLHNLHPPFGSTKNRKRIGRGPGSGRGGTSTRGHNGYKSRSGSPRKIGFEGGQMPLQKRIPKYGFKNFNKKEYVIINLDKLQKIIDKFKVNKIDIEFLHKIGIIKNKQVPKILGRGNINHKINIDIDHISKSALSKIEKINSV
ncbi:MAG: 50S ribosomal protein L15 [Bacteroides sp.]|nr:MAG: 50S ribosomal protein L15 [Bacteroides sp.]